MRLGYIDEFFCVFSVYRLDGFDQLQSNSISEILRMK
jgi:hypothetical protein